MVRKYRRDRGPGQPIAYYKSGPYSRFFFDQYKEISTRWAGTLAAIPVVDPANEVYWDAAGGADLQQFGQFVHIDRLALDYNYTHEQAFDLSWSEVMTIIVLGRRRDVVDYRYQEIKSAAERKK